MLPGHRIWLPRGVEAEYGKEGAAALLVNSMMRNMVAFLGEPKSNIASRTGEAPQEPADGRSLPCCVTNLSAVRDRSLSARDFNPK